MFVEGLLFVVLKIDLIYGLFAFVEELHVSIVELASVSRFVGLVKGISVLNSLLNDLSKHLGYFVYIMFSVISPNVVCVTQLTQDESFALADPLSQALVFLTAQFARISWC